MFKEFFSLIKESIIEHVKHRLFVVTVLFLVLFGILIYRLFDLQIVNGEKYQESFTYKSVKTVAVKATRGNIYDCNGKLLAYNEASYTLSYISGTDLTEAAFFIKGDGPGGRRLPQRKRLRMNCVMT